MAITRDSTLDLDQVGARVRILTGVKSSEIVDSDLSELISMSIEWFENETASTYVVNTKDMYDNAVIFYSCYLMSIAQNGMGIENIRIGEIEIEYAEDDPYIQWLELANQAIISVNDLTIKRSTYNADPTLGTVDWLKNIDGSSSTLNTRKKPRGM